MSGQSGWEAGTWLNPPQQHTIEDGDLAVVTDKATDFWRETHYGFTRDSGHMLGFATGPDFTAQLRIRARFDSLYDQAGLMVRLDEARWLKAGIEISDGRPMLSSVLTVDRSDWATAPYAGDAGDFWMRLTVKDGVVRVQASQDGILWPLVRLAPFPRADTYHVGPMCCTPERAGLSVRFSDFSLGPALGRDLHDLS